MNDKKIIVENALYILGLKDSNIDEATRRYTYRARSPGVKPTTGIKLILPKTSSMGQKIQKVLDGDDPKKLKQMNNLVIGREDDGKEISLEFKTAASREKFRKMMNEDVQIDEATQHIVHVNVSRTGFRKLEAMIASLDGYRESDYSDGKARFYFDAKKHDSAERKKVAEFIKKTRGAEFSHAMKLEDVQVNEMSPFNVMGGKKTATPRKMGRDLENRLKMTKPSEYTFSAPAAGGGTFAVIPVNMERPSMLSQAGVMMATFDKRGKVLAYYGTHMNTDAAKKFAKKEGLIESVQLDEEVAARDPQKMVKGLSRKAKQEVADQLNKMNLGGYGDYKATTTNVHKFRPKDLMAAMKKVMRLDELRKIPDAFERTRKIKNVFRDSDIKRLSKSVGNEAYDGGFRGDKEDLPGSVKDMVRNIHAYSDDDLIVILLADIPHASIQARMALQGRGHKVNSPARRKSDIKLRKS